MLLAFIYHEITLREDTNKKILLYKTKNIGIEHVINNVRRLKEEGKAFGQTMDKFFYKIDKIDKKDIKYIYYIYIELKKDELQSSK